VRFYFFIYLNLVLRPSSPSPKGMYVDSHHRTERKSKGKSSTARGMPPPQHVQWGKRVFGGMGEMKACRGSLGKTFPVDL
jgi:hypothetical protein